MLVVVSLEDECVQDHAESVVTSQAAWLVQGYNDHESVLASVGVLEHVLAGCVVLFAFDNVDVRVDVHAGSLDGDGFLHRVVVAEAHNNSFVHSKDLAPHRR